MNRQTINIPRIPTGSYSDTYDRVSLPASPVDLDVSHRNETAPRTPLMSRKPRRATLAEVFIAELREQYEAWK